MWEWEGKGRGEKHHFERETSSGHLLYMPQPGTKAATQACGLTRNQTGNVLVCGRTHNPLSHTSQGQGLCLNDEKGNKR